MRADQRRSDSGVIAGLLGCVFGTLEILTIGLIFVPLAALCAFFGLLRGVVGKSVTDIGLSLLAWLTVAIGAAVSPSVWIVLLGVVGLLVGDPHPH